MTSSAAYLPDSITTAELRVFELAATSTLCNKELAERMHLSTRTVKAHLQSIYRKMGWQGRNSRIKLMKWCLARENGNGNHA